MFTNKHDSRAFTIVAESDELSTASIDTISSFGEEDTVVEDPRVVKDALFDDDDLMAIVWTDEDSLKIPRESGFCLQSPQNCFKREILYVSESDNESMEISVHSIPELSTLEASKRGSLPRKKSTGSTGSHFLKRVPDEIVCEIFTFLDVPTLLRVNQVSRRFRDCGHKDIAGWDSHFKELCRRKLHIDSSALLAAKSEDAMTAYKMAWEDANSRAEVTISDLCYDPETKSGTVWHFRFKEAAGNSWTSFDPWHAGRAPRRMVFLRNGTVKEFVEDPTRGPGHLVDPFSDAPHLQANPTSVGMFWRFIPAPMDLPTRPKGAYLRLNIAGRDVPTYVSRRSPTGNWGFLIENCWGVFASFQLPLKNETGRGAPLRPTRMRLRRTSDGGVHWLNVQGMESDSDDDDDSAASASCSTEEGRLLADRALAVTSRSQWREALLYNYGSIVLPEGMRAQEEFDRIFNSYRHPIRNLGNPVR